MKLLSGEMDGNCKKVGPFGELSSNLNIDLFFSDFITPTFSDAHTYKTPLISLEARQKVRVYTMWNNFCTDAFCGIHSAFCAKFMN